MDKGFRWIQHAASPVSNLFTFRKNEKPQQEMNDISPPILVVYTGIEKALAEHFVELFTICTNKIPSGCVIPVLNYSNTNQINKWLKPPKFVNDDSDESFAFRPVLRIVLWLYSTIDDTPNIIDQKMKDWKTKCLLLLNLNPNIFCFLFFLCVFAIFFWTVCV